MLINRLRNTLTDYRALLPYAILGILAGAFAAGIILLFDIAITALGSTWLADASPDGFEQLPPWLRFVIPAAGAALLGALFSLLKPEDREVGIVHVLSRMHSHYGQLPLRNAVAQFIGGAIALASGQSGGREGPGIHLSAAVNSQLATALSLPNNSQRILIACGTAGGIAVAFNTPLAGVIFAMEVIVAEYTVVGFIPVILAAVTATAIKYGFQNSDAIFTIPPVHLTSLLELPFIVALGFAAGCVISLFIYMLKKFLRFSQAPVFLRFTAAGLVTGGLAVLVPEIMGMGYDSLNDILLNQLAPGLLIALLVCKILATACGVGLGMPVGLIGPSLLIGACLGGLMGGLGTQLVSVPSSETTLYVVIGMGAAMAAVLNAPLAAILCVMELTQSVRVVFPSMLAIIAATLTTSVIFKQRSAHQTVLNHLQRIIPDDPVSQMLHQTNVMTVMDRGIRVLAHQLDAEAIQKLRDKPPQWVLVERDGEPLYLIQGKALAEQLQDSQEALLTEIDVRRWSMSTVSQRATLREALDSMRKNTVEAVLVSSRGASDGPTVSGVVTRDTIDQFYLRRF